MLLILQKSLLALPCSHRSRFRIWLAACLMLAILGSQWAGLQHSIAHADRLSHSLLSFSTADSGPHCHEGHDHSNDQDETHSCAAWDALTEVSATPPNQPAPNLLSFTHTLIARTLAQILPASARSNCWARAPPK